MQSRIQLAAFVLILAIGATISRAADDTNRVRTITSFDPDWRFFKALDADAEKPAAGAEKPEFNDSSWMALDVPHDWSIDGPVDEKNPSSFRGGFFPGGVGWYRRHFPLPADAARRRVFIDFDGVMENSDVWINGFHLGKRPYGYVGFRYEMTGHLNFGPGQENVLAVRADNSLQPAARWYTGAGIYRHVRLVMTERVHIDHWGTFITTPSIKTGEAMVRVRSTIVNESDAPARVSVQVDLIGPDGKTVKTNTSDEQEIPAGRSADLNQYVTVMNPQLWNPDQPNMYKALSKVILNGKTLDDDVTPFGIRQFYFDGGTGFWLNGKNIKLLGVCLHAEAGAMGSAVPLSAWERRLSTLKQFGANAVRTAHNPQSPEFLDLCDRMGIIVMDELFDCWISGKYTDQDYHLYWKDWWKTDAADTVARDRNHPGIVLYSAGNEIHDINARSDRGIQLFTPLRDVIHDVDPTRPVTLAILQPNANDVYTGHFADLMDVVGQNYHERELVAANQGRPYYKILGTENHADLPTWSLLRDSAAYAGQFLWTGVDYLGESHAWPNIGAGAGFLDRTDTPKPVAYQRQSWWSSTPMVHLARTADGNAAPGVVAEGDVPAGVTAPPRVRNRGGFSDWTPARLDAHPETIVAYSNCDQVELFLNDKSFGSQARIRPNTDKDAPRVWTVTFEPGSLKAVASNNGKTVANDELRTAGAAAKIVLAADRQQLPNDWDDVSYVGAKVADANGVVVPNATDLIAFKITGPGAIAAVDNADNASHEPFHAAQRQAYQGECFAILRANANSGQITLTATAPELADGTVTIEANAPRKAD